MNIRRHLGTSCSATDIQRCSLLQHKVPSSQRKKPSWIQVTLILMCSLVSAVAVSTTESRHRLINQAVIPSGSPFNRMDRLFEKNLVHNVSRGWQSPSITIYGGNGPSVRRLSASEPLVSWVETHLKVNSRISLYLAVFLTVAGTLFMTAGNVLLKLVSDTEGKGRRVCFGKDIQWVYGMLGKYNVRVLFPIETHMHI